MRETRVLTCEHGGNRVPAAVAGRFATAAARRALSSHRGWDRGALEAARALARAWRTPLTFSTVSRLVVEPNRSERHPRLFSEFTRTLPADVRETLLERHWRRHRRDVEAAIGAAVEGGARVLHVSVHTFTPVLRGERRNADIGLLYDPRREPERALCVAWQGALRATAPRFRVRRNYPYRGADDGFTTHLRRVFPEDRYLGIELELNRALFDRRRDGWRHAVAALVAAHATLGR